jgi:hypothetical protein
VRLHLWPQPYVVARLADVPEVAGRVTVEGAPVCLTVGHDEVIVLAPEEVVERLGVGIEHVDGGWRALSLEARFAPGVVGVMEALSTALARVGVPVMVFSSHDTDHVLVPEALLGRALAAINQVDLDRFVGG